MKTEQVNNDFIAFCCRFISNRPFITEWHHSDRFTERYRRDPKSRLTTHGNENKGEEQAAKQVP